MARDFSYELLNFFRTVEVVEQRETHVLRVNAITARFADIGVLHDCYLLGPHVVGAHRSSKKLKTAEVFRSAIYAPQGFGIGVIRSLNYAGDLPLILLECHQMRRWEGVKPRCVMLWQACGLCIHIIASTIGPVEQLAANNLTISQPAIASLLQHLIRPV